MTHSGMGKAAIKVGRVVLLAGAVLSLFLVRAVYAPWTFAAAAILPLLAILAFGSRRSSFGIWAVYILGFVGFAHLRTVADNWGPPAAFLYPVEWDRLLFGGTLPGHWLQRLFYQEGMISALDWSALTVHLSYYVSPHLVAFAVWGWRRDRLGQYVGAAVLVFYGSLVVYWLVPTAPPWLAADQGMIEHITRIAPVIGGSTAPVAYDYVNDVVGTNPVAAMPSLHFAAAVVVAFGLALLGRIGQIAGLGYVAAMAFSLMYLGEHYLVDLLAGAFLGVGAWVVARRTSVALGWARRPDSDGPSEPETA